MPVDMVSATLVLHDGERFEAMFFVPSGEDVAKLLAAQTMFVPVVRNGRVCLVARTAIAAVGITSPVVELDPDHALPTEEQRVQVKLRSGMILDGLVRWCSPAEGRRRTTDYLNADECCFELHAELTYLVVKAHVTTVQEC